jgi:hydrogenase assembly chaperone HypC/HupF
MCLAIPGQVSEVKGKKVIVDFSGRRVPTQSHFVKVKVGDWVMVFGDYVIEKTTEKRAREIKKRLGI